MSYKDLVELDEDAEMIDLGVASLETEGSETGSSETDDAFSPPGIAH